MYRPRLFCQSSGPGSTSSPTQRDKNKVILRRAPTTTKATARSYDVTPVRFIPQGDVPSLFHQTAKTLPSRHGHFPRCSRVASDRTALLWNKKDGQEKLFSCKVNGSLSMVMKWNFFFFFFFMAVVKRVNEGTSCNLICSLTVSC